MRSAGTHYAFVVVRLASHWFVGFAGLIVAENSEHRHQLLNKHADGFGVNHDGENQTGNRTIKMCAVINTTTFPFGSII